MNKSLRWKLILAFVLVFLAGVACGFFGTVHAHYFFTRMDSESMTQHMKQRLRAELKLTPQQMQQISPIIDHAASQLKTKREQTMRDVHEIFEQTHRDMQPFLTPEQRTKLEELEKRHRHLLHRHGFMAPGPPRRRRTIKLKTQDQPPSERNNANEIRLGSSRSFAYLAEKLM